MRKLLLGERLSAFAKTAAGIFSKPGKKRLPPADEASEKVKRFLTANSVFDYYNTRNHPESGYNIDELYASLGLPLDLFYSDYVQKYERQDIVSRIVRAPVLGSWRYKPSVYDEKESDTAFKRDYQALTERLRFYFQLTKLDIQATLGRFAVLYLGLDDNTDPSIPTVSASDVLYLSPIPENRAAIQTYEEDTNSPRYGMPDSYTITINPEVTESITKSVDHSRVIHVAENTLDSEVYGIPYLKPIFNNLIGLETLSACSPVMYKSGARPGYIAQPEENSIVSDSLIADMKAQLDEYLKKMPRWMYLEGMKITPLPIQVVSPSDHVDVQLKLISAATRIPMRILTGSERGELASGQDERSWLSYLEERRLNVSEKLILRPVIDKLIGLGVLSEPVGGDYTVEWPPLIVKSEKEQAEISLLRAQTFKTRGEAVGGEDDYPLEYVLKDFGKTDEEIKAQMEVVEKQIREERPLRGVEEDDTDPEDDKEKRSDKNDDS